jgi:hypothetical protein
MRKSKNKKSWLEKLNEVDAKQEARLKAKNTSRTSSQSNNQMQQVSKKILVVLSLALPFLAWITAALFNPSGWASKDPSVIVFMFAAVCGQYWFLVLPALIIFFLLVFSNRIYESVLLVFLFSFVNSIFVYTTTVNANESEFTG